MARKSNVTRAPANGGLPSKEQIIEFLNSAQGKAGKARDRTRLRRIRRSTHRTEASARRDGRRRLACRRQETPSREGQAAARYGARNHRTRQGWRPRRKAAPMGRRRRQTSDCSRRCSTRRPAMPRSASAITSSHAWKSYRVEAAAVRLTKQRRSRSCRAKNAACSASTARRSVAAERSNPSIARN